MHNHHIGMLNLNYNGGIKMTNQYNSQFLKNLGSPAHIEVRSYICSRCKRVHRKRASRIGREHVIYWVCKK